MKDSTPPTDADLTLLGRLERVPFGRFQWRMLWMGGLGYTFDAMDGAMIAFILPAVTARGRPRRSAGSVGCLPRS